MVDKKLREILEGYQMQCERRNNRVTALETSELSKPLQDALCPFTWRSGVAGHGY